MIITSKVRNRRVLLIIRDELPCNCVHDSWSECNSAWSGPAPESSCASSPPATKHNCLCVCTWTINVRILIISLGVFMTWDVCSYLYSHLLWLLLQLLDDLIASAAIVTSCWWAVLLPLLQTDPTEIIFTLKEREVVEGAHFMIKAKIKYPM